jgi:hypothetical protein
LRKLKHDFTRRSRLSEGILAPVLEQFEPLTWPVALFSELIQNVSDQVQDFQRLYSVSSSYIADRRQGKRRKELEWLNTLRLQYWSSRWANEALYWQYQWAA